MSYAKDLEVKLVSGAIAGVTGTLIIYPLDMIKTRLQNGHYPSIHSCYLELYNKSGIRGFYSGLRANLTGIIPEKAIKLAVNDFIREYFGRKLQMDSDRIPIKYGMFAGAAAGTCQVIATNPMEIVKIRLQMKTSTMASVVKELGIRGLYKGTLATLARDVPFSLIFFPTVSMLKITLSGGEKPNLPTIFGSGIIAGSLAAVLVTPMDVVKTQLQVVDSKHKSQLDCYRYFSLIRSIYSQYGFKGLFKGAIPRAMIVSVLNN